jgi:IclR family transcriptional regulator, acetate operon repressor
VEQLFQEDRPATQAVERGAQLLVAVLASERPLGVTELARASRLPKSTTSRLLGALERHGLVARDGPRGLLRPGPAILTYAQRALYERNVVALAEPALAALAAASGETINLAVPAGDGVEHLAQVDGRHFLGTGQWVGRRVELHCTAVGKVFLAAAVASLPAGPLPARGPATVVSREALTRELAAVQRDGYATAVDELEAGLAAVAAPVRGADGRVVAALSISGPTLRLGAREIERLTPILKLEAQRLSGRLGHIEKGEHAA